MAHQALTNEMTDEEFDRHVMGILARELGPGGYARYLMLHRSGKGDYTAERHTWQAGLTVESILAAMQSNATPPK